MLPEETNPDLLVSFTIFNPLNMLLSFLFLSIVLAADAEPLGNFTPGRTKVPEPNKTKFSKIISSETPPNLYFSGILG